MNLPNFLSVSRILLLFPIIIFFENELFLFSVMTFIVASVTDYLDGLLARKYSQTSDFGALLDLLADKIFVSVMLIWMVFNFGNLYILAISILIITREITVSYLRLYLVSSNMNLDEVKSDSLGKIKTALQMIGLGLVLISQISSHYIFQISISFLILSALISWISLINYSYKWIL